MHLRDETEKLQLKVVAAASHHGVAALPTRPHNLLLTLNPVFYPRATEGKCGALQLPWRLRVIEMHAARCSILCARRSHPCISPAADGLADANVAAPKHVH